MFRHSILYAAIISTLVSGSPLAEAPTDARGPTRALLADIVTWLAANAGLPPNYQLPRVELVPANQLPAMRFKGFRRGSGQKMASSSVAQAAPHREVIAVYNEDIRTILLADTWTGKTPVEASILVHEMVHHLQSINGLKYECPGARERPAYLAQDQWLRQFGLSLEQEFEVDAATLLVISACLW